MDILSIFILVLVVSWLIFSIKYIRKNKGNGCTGDCSKCGGCNRK